jgi:hypothetical protein
MYKTLIIGNIGADATVKEIGERQVVNFSVAVQVRKDLTQWVECSYWRNIDQSVKWLSLSPRVRKSMLKASAALMFGITNQNSK